MASMTELVTTARRQGPAENPAHERPARRLHEPARHRPGARRARGGRSGAPVRQRDRAAAMKPSAATIASITAGGIGPSVVTAITARSLRDSS